MSNQSILLSLIIYMICVTRSLIAGVVSPCMLSDIYNACSSSSYLVLCVNSACNLKPCHVKKKTRVCAVWTLNSIEYRERQGRVWRVLSVKDAAIDSWWFDVSCLQGTTIDGFNKFMSPREHTSVWEWHVLIHSRF